MLKSDACAIIARRLNLPMGRVGHLVQRASEAGLLPVARGSDRPDLGALELARLFLAAVCDNGLGRAAATVTEFSALTTERGVSLIDILESLFAGRISATGIRSAIFQIEPAVCVLIGEHHLQFGGSLATGGAATHTIIQGDTLAAICAELQGLSQKQADEFVALGRLSSALT
ncbi:hypothetical protein IVB30_19680 [Bradyrhizobium sp. 200]|uniref:hypothetical protein n=1 Tax=Bradyrhizobium sp. 200 TaxID=2782665 RepID=UPI001FFF91AF|nr:hypothetical protein [Bradyrhizobium sp. 200]UPJ53334.1 hypothetical protein IVB30_19680 [Bradyrhizobium sp. 200]